MKNIHLKLISTLFISAIFLTTCNSTAFAQEYEPGFIILESNDTLVGQVRVFEEIESSEKVLLRDSLGYLKAPFMSHVKAYKRGMEYYEKKKFDLKGYGTVTKYMRVLDTGKVNLCVVYYELYESQVVQQPNNNYRLVDGPEIDYYLQKENEALFLVPKNGFRKKLSQYFIKHKPLSIKIEQGQYRLKDLRQIVFDYNQNRLYD